MSKIKASGTSSELAVDVNKELLLVRQQAEIKAGEAFFRYGAAFRGTPAFPYRRRRGYGGNSYMDTGNGRRRLGGIFGVAAGV